MSIFFASVAGEVIGAVATVIAAFIGLGAAWIGARKVRQETVEGSSATGTSEVQTAATRGTLSALSREVEGYIVRFIIFFLVIQLWTAILRLTDPFRYFGFGAYFGDYFIDLGAGVVYALIFLLLGLPLLIDIARRYGIRGRGGIRGRR